MIRSVGAALMVALLLGGGTAPISAASVTSQIVPIVRQVVPIRRDILPLKRVVQPLKVRAAVVKREKTAVTRAMKALKAERTRQGELKLNISSDILFAFDRADIRPQAARTLAQVALLIREKHPRQVRIEGHTDAKGSDAYNMRLSLRRAESVRNWLVEREGINPRLIVVKGFGERRPVAPNTLPDGRDNPEGRRLNRRVEIFLR